MHLGINKNMRRLKAKCEELKRDIRIIKDQEFIRKYDPLSDFQKEVNEFNIKTKQETALYKQEMIKHNLEILSLKEIANKQARIIHNSKQKSVNGKHCFNIFGIT